MPTTISNTHTIGKAGAAQPHQQNWEETICRHTVGRISSLAKVPILAFGALAQTGKTIFKAIVATVTAGKIKGHKYTFKAVARDAICIAGFLKGTAKAVRDTVLAPKKHEYTLKKAVKTTYNIVFEDNYHTNFKGERSISEVVDLVFKKSKKA